MVSAAGASAPAHSDRRQRALEALERRLAAEAERLQEQHCPVSRRAKQTPKSFNRLQEINRRAFRKAKRALNQEDGGQSEQRTGRHPELSASASFTKDEYQPVYSELSGIVVDDLLQSAGDLEAPSANDSVSKIVNDIVSKGDEGSKFIKRGKSLRIDTWILLDNFVQKNDNSKDTHLKAAVKSLSRRSRKHMSRRQHRKCGSFNLPKEFHIFDLFTPMHEMWKGYILELLKETRKKHLSECLLRADLHGAFFLVAECKTTSFKGVNGIMIRETAETFGIITQDNHFRVVPKVGSVFMFQADCWKITLHGDKLSKKMLNQKSPHQLTR